MTEGVGALSGWLTREGTEVYQQTVLQPSFAPPPLVFPVVWGILYALMGIGAARVWVSPPSGARSAGINVFIVQLVVNFFWSLIFFNLQAYGLALMWLVLLWVLILGMIVLFFRVDRLAGLLQIPYLLWVTFAAVLNFAVWRLNG